MPVYMLLHTVTYTHITCIHLCSRAGERQKFQSHVFTSQYYFFSSPQSSFCFFWCTFSQRFSATLLQIQKLYFSSGYLEAIWEHFCLVVLWHYQQTHWYSWLITFVHSLSPENCSFPIYSQSKRDVYHSFEDEYQGNVAFSPQNENKLAKITQINNYFHCMV